ncbi:MAG: hypothetical protein ACRC0I_06205 [Sediminibacterium sp.]|jgi:hypothetical protein|nr:hypothetical protein [Chitinophagaceae bacterium]MCA6446357.1 hypothetical protein [Chitinophagaceae bacterium]
MRTEDEFWVYWKENRIREKHSARIFIRGLSAGFAVGALVVAFIFSGWYERATMVANAKMSAMVLFIAIMLLSFFVAFFYRRFYWEMQEQKYLEIDAKKNKQAQKQPKSSDINL